jgi:hypothetical protein
MLKLKTGKFPKNLPVSLNSFSHLLELLLFQKDLNAGGIGWWKTSANQGLVTNKAVFQYEL